MVKKTEDVLNLDQLTLITEEFLRRTAQSPGIVAYKPHENQEKFHRSTAKEKLYIGGNRSGKTVAGSTEDIMWLIGEHKYRTDLPEPPIRGRYVAVDIEDGIKKIALPEVSKWVPTKLLKNNSWEDSYDKQSRTLTLTNGSFLEFMSYEQEPAKFAGTSRHFVHFDEEPPEEVFNECLMRLVDTDGSYWITMTPLIELTWVETRIYEPWLKGNKSIYVLEVNTEENPHISIEALDRLTRDLSFEEKAARKTGTFITRTGLIYARSFSSKNYLDGGNIIDDIFNKNFKEYTKGWGHFVCMDHGYTNPCVFLFCAFDGEGRIIVYDEIYERRKIVRELAEIYRERLEILKIVPVYCVGDPSIRNTSPITRTSVQSEYAEHGVNIALGNNDVRAGIVRVQNRFSKQLLFITKRCINTLDEIRKYRWDKHMSSKLEARRNLKENPLKRNDHAMDALRYGVMSRPALENEEPIKFGNVLNAPETGSRDIDYEVMFGNPNRTNELYDSSLGTQW